MQCKKCKMKCNESETNQIEMQCNVANPKRNAISCNLTVRYLLFPNSYLFPVINLEGPQLEFSRLVSWMKFETREDYEKYFSRLEAFPTQVNVLGYWL